MKVVFTLAEDAEREVVPVARPRRRLVLLSQNVDPNPSDHEWDPDTESAEGVSDVRIVQKHQRWKPQFWRRDSKLGPGRSLRWIR